MYTTIFVHYTDCCGALVCRYNNYCKGAVPKLGEHIRQENGCQLQEELVKDVSHGVQCVVASRVHPFLVVRRGL